MAQQRAYPVDAFLRDREKGAWRLDPTFTPDRLCHVAQSGGLARLLSALGQEIASGAPERLHAVTVTDREGQEVCLDLIAIGADQICIASAPLVPGRLYSEQRASLGGCRIPGPEEIARLPALGAGVHLSTQDGLLPVDWLRPGDRLMTRDHGFQPLLWVGQHVAPRRAPEAARPVRIGAEALGLKRPERDITVSPGLGVLLAGDELQLWFAAAEMLADMATILPAAPRVVERQTLYTLLFARPEVVLAEGIWVSSVEASPGYLSLIPEGPRSALVPLLRHGKDAVARRRMLDWEVEMFRRDRNARNREIAA